MKNDIKNSKQNKTQQTIIIIKKKGINKGRGTNEI